jgi:hypothetical protein
MELITPVLGVNYLSRMPRPGELPAGQVIVHNRVKPRRRIGAGGFRIWMQAIEDKIEPCPCGWAPELGEHYRVILAHPAPKSTP